MLDLAIVGGGPGGLMTAWYLRKKLGALCKVTIFEATERVGGKILSKKFDSSPALYEAGVAEIYDYSMLGPDPLRDLVQHLGLQTIQMDAEQVQLDGEVLDDVAGMRRKYGNATADAIEAWRKLCTRMISPQEYYEGIGSHDNDHPWAFINCEELLDREVKDPVAKRFIKVMARSDLATESHNTNGLNALKNFVMDIEGYIGLYSIQNGNEQIVERLREEIDADIQFNHRVLKVGKSDTGRDLLNMMNGKGPETRDFDLVVMCLPHNWLATMGWDNEQLRASMVKHVAYFDRPAHYLRIALLFDEPFWGEKFPVAWWMSEAFGGCCVYVEGARHDVGRNGVLNFLVAGSDALAYVNLRDDQLIDAAIKSLPPSLGDARAHFVEGKIHRWLSSVNAIPGGLAGARRADQPPARTEGPRGPGCRRRLPVRFDPERPVRLLGCGDRPDPHRIDQAALCQGAGRFADLRQDRPRLFRQLSRRRSLRRGVEPVHRSRLPDAADQADLEPGEGLQAPDRGFRQRRARRRVRKRGVDAFGVESNRAVHARTPTELKKYNSSARSSTCRSRTSSSISSTRRASATSATSRW